MHARGAGAGQAFSAPTLILAHSPAKGQLLSPDEMIAGHLPHLCRATAHHSHGAPLRTG